MSRGNRRDKIFLDDVDWHDFIKTLAEACQRTTRTTTWGAVRHPLQAKRRLPQKADQAARSELISGLTQYRMASSPKLRKLLAGHPEAFALRPGAQLYRTADCLRVLAHGLSPASRRDRRHRSAAA
jgi:hypothetical protein